MTTRISHWIDGTSTSGRSGRSGQVFNPATGEQTGEVDFATAEEIDHVVSGATEAAAVWRSTSLARRTGVLFAFRELLAAGVDDLAAIITAEHGKVLGDALGEIARGLENVEYACGVAEHMKGGYSEQAGTGVDVYSIRQPLGVVAGITPFNFPAMVPLWMCANAIATGNAFILKPSEKDPSAALFLAELWKKAGLPDGVFSVVHGDKVAVDAILEHPGIAAVSFVGSTPIARYIYETGTRNGKRVQALGGAKNHMLVLPDADVDMAADAAVSAAYGAAGERCMAISVAVTVGDVADPLVDAIAARLPKLRIGDGTDPDSEIGPLITREHRDKVADYVRQGVEAGAIAVVDGREADVPADGFFLGTTLLDRVSPEMTVYTDEIFGPVLCVVRQDSYDESIALINANQFANGTAIFTRDGGAARQFQFDVEVGMVGVNVPIPVPVSYYSFGGWKASLFGDTHMYGPEGIAFYTRGKVVTSRWPDPATSKIDLGFPHPPLNLVSSGSTDESEQMTPTYDGPLAGIPTDEATVRKLDRAHVFHSWSAQALIDPLPIASAEGSRFTDYDGKSYLDFSSQLVNVNIGYQHPKLVKAIADYAAQMTTIQPSFANDARSEAARLITEVAGHDLNQVFFTNAGAEANENAVRLARLHTGRPKILAMYRSYHGATHGVIGLTGDPRRWGTEPHTMPGIVHFWGPYPYRSAFHSTSAEEETTRALQHLRDTLMVEGPQTVAAIILEPVVGTNGILVPPPGYLAGVRDICDEHGILLIADEVMAGFGRCGEWFAIQHWDVRPDLISFAKGVNSGYVPLGGVVISDPVAETFQQRAYPGGLTYSGHPLACASAVASINIFKEEGIVERARSLGTDVIGPELAKIADRHPSVGEVRGLGVFWALELVTDRATREPLVPYNAAGDAAAPMNAFAAACKERGLWPMTHFNRTHVVPPCTITEQDLREGLSMLDDALETADTYYTGS